MTKMLLFAAFLGLLLCFGCLATDQTPRNSTSACPTNYDPVCGKDGRTYANSCIANSSNMEIARSGECSSPAPSCSDSDFGRDVLAKGTAKTSSETKTDSCVSSNKVLEYYCSGNSIESANLECPNGYSCSDGYCTQGTTPTQNNSSNQNNNLCTDSDGGINSGLRGRVTDGSNIREDECSTYNVVKEYYCANNRLSDTLVQCQGGYQCSGGVCIPQSQVCSDSDDGRTPNTRGRVTVTSTAITSNYDDVCVDDSTVREYFCSGNFQDSERVSCSSSRRCEDGRCVEASCSDSDPGNSLYSSGTVRVGSNSYVDECTSSSAGTEWYCDSNRARSQSFTCPSTHRCDSGRCVERPTPVAQSCTETGDSGEDAGLRGTVRGVSSSGSSFDRSDECATGDSVTEYSCDLSRADSYRSREFMCGDGYRCSSGACAVMCERFEDASGTDTSRSFNTYLGASVFPDACSGESSVKKSMCSGSTTSERIVSCPNGFSCSSGACTVPRCTDLDGSDYTTGSKAYYGSDTYSDGCFDSEKVIEYVCSGTSSPPVASTVNCLSLGYSGCSEDSSGRGRCV